MVRSLEGMSADRLQKLDQRLCKLESRAVPAGPINVEPVRAVERFATHRTPSTAGGGSAELAPIYHELDALAELVSSHHAAATHGIERVRSLERAVLELRRHLERPPDAASLPR